ncbi:hypothetical protein ScPMuIL_013003 [Solemya velum]
MAVAQNVIFVTVCSLYLFSFSSSLSTLDLNGAWIVSNEVRGYNVSGSVPGSMYTALLAAGVIQDPYYRRNDETYRWIAKEDWNYSRTFTVIPKLMAMKTIVLVCEGLDTVGKVFVNGKVVGKSDNMFVRYTFDVKDLLKIGENIIKVEFQSAVNYAAERSKQYSYTVPPTCPTPQSHGDCHVNMIRKEQCSFSWDWGPSFPTQGIWRDIYIQGYNSAVIRDVTTETMRGSDGLWTLQVAVFFEVTSVLVSGQLRIQLDKTTVLHVSNITISQSNSSHTLTLKIPKEENIMMWWPNGYGNQTLYQLYVYFESKISPEISSKKIKIGFRTVKLNQEYVTQNKSQGREFYFVINGQSIFAKGSNWVPADSFLETVTRARIQNRLQSAKDVHMNMLRVWGGGVYESDEFYEIADELGIMIWQDFMFGCAMYPTDKSFLSSVTSEVLHQIRRLKHHPSIIAYSGNNENEKALRQNWYGTSTNFTRYYNDYIQLYKETLMPVVVNEDSSRPFLPSSPTDGLESESEGWVAQDPGSEYFGDIHDYRYLDPYFDYKVYRIPRFASEYGLQSWCSYETLEPVFAESDMDYWSDLCDYRQHHPFGNFQMMAEALLYMKLPNSSDVKQKFKDLIYITQINQAIAMKTETEHYRRWQNRLDSTGRGHTMGALYWQLDDIWQAPTWASIEYTGKWKMLHYYARHFFAPMLISPIMDGEFLDVYVVVDQVPPQPITNNLTISLHRWDQMGALQNWVVEFKINSTAGSVFRRNVTDLLTKTSCDLPQRCFFYMYLTNTQEPSAWVTLSTFREAIGLQKANIKITNLRTTGEDKIFNLTITTDNFAPFVWIDAYGIKGRFSDNGFLLAQSQKNISFYAWESVTLDRFNSSLSIKSLMDVYYE